MKIKYDSPLAKRNMNFTKEKFASKTFQETKIFKKKFNLSSSNFETDIKFNLKLNRSKNLKIKPDIKQIEYDFEHLEGDLMIFHSELEKRKNELFNLKIKFNKLLTDNINNKTLIAKILSIPKNKPFNKEVLFDEIYNFKLTKEERQTLKVAYLILKLKLELESKKKLFSDKLIYLNMLNENSKIKVVSYLQSEYFIKCEQQRSLINSLINYEKKYDLLENKIIELKEKLEKQCINSENLITEEYACVEQINQILNIKSDILKEINILKEKIKKHQKINKAKEREIKKLVEKNLFEQNRLEEIEDHSFFNSDIIILKNKEKENLEMLLKKTSEEIKSLQNELFNLKIKYNNYQEEKPKLIQKYKESKNNINKIKYLEKELQSLKETIEKFKEIKKKNQGESNEIKLKNNGNYEYLKENDDNKIEFKKRIKELKLMVDKMKNKKYMLKTEINRKENEYNEICIKIIKIKNKYDKNNLDMKEKLKKGIKNNFNQIIMEKQKEIDNLKAQKQKLIQNKKILEDENKLMEGKIKEFDKELNEYDEISEEFSKIKDKITEEKYNELFADSEINYK